MKLNTYCNECLARTKQHCEGRDDTTGDAATVDEVCVWADDGESYEIRPDYIQTGVNSGSSKPHGLKFCPDYQLDMAQLPRVKSAQALRDEFNAQRAANKAATKAEKDAAKTEKLAEKKLKAKQKAKARYDTKQKANAEYERELEVQQAAMRHMGKVKQATQSAMQPETTSGAVARAMEIDDDFGDLII